MKLRLASATLLWSVGLRAQKPACTSPPPDLGKGTWSCNNNLPYPHGTRCTISGDNCSGTTTCSKGNWKGKFARFCPKTCDSLPSIMTPKGGHWECPSGEWSSCEFVIHENFKCTNSVACNSKSGKLKGKVKCRVQIPDNPLGMDHLGTWSCGGGGPNGGGNQARICRFTCFNGSPQVTRLEFHKPTGQWIGDNGLALEDFCGVKTTAASSTTSMTETTTTSVQTSERGAFCPKKA